MARRLYGMKHRKRMTGILRKDWRGLNVRNNKTMVERIVVTILNVAIVKNELDRNKV